MRLRVRKISAGPILGSRGHVRGKIQPESFAFRIGFDQTAKHFARAGGHFEHLHPVPDSGVPERAGVRPGMKKERAGGINGGHES